LYIELLVRVFTYEEMVQQLVEAHGIEYVHHMNVFKEQLLQDQSLDTRMFAAWVVEEASKWMPDKRPAMILFYSSIYSPRIELSGETQEEQNLIQALEDRLRPFSRSISTQLLSATSSHIFLI
jgi:arginine utilization protein RocB